MTIVFFRIIEAVFTGVLEQLLYHLFFEREKDNIEDNDSEKNDNNIDQDIEYQKK